MKQTAKVFISSYFIIYALLYLTQRYTTFEMHPMIIVIIGTVLLIITGTMLNRRILQTNIFTVSILVFTLFIIFTSLM